MINFCLNNDEKSILKNLCGKELIKYRHDPLDKFGEETVYGRIELFFEDSIILINYDYELYPIFGSKDDEHPRFSIKNISEEEATSALENITQVNIGCHETISRITLVEDYIEIEWDSKKDCSRILKAIIIKFKESEIAIQGDYMMPLLDIIKGEEVATKLIEPGREFENDSEIKFKAERFFIELF